MLLGVRTALLVALIGALAAADETPVRFARPQPYAAHFANGPRLPVAADMDGDGHADLACVYAPDGGILDLGLSEGGLRMRQPRAVAKGLLGDAVAVAARPGEIGWLTKSGAVGLFSAGQVREAGRADPGGTALLAFDGGFLVPNRSGVWLLAGVGPLQGPAGYRAVAACRDAIFWLDDAGLHRGQIADGKIEGALLGPADGEALTAGDFDGDGRADAICGGRCRLAAGSLPFPVDLPSGRGTLLAADVTRDGRADLLWCTPDDAIFLLVNHAPGAADPDADGLTNDQEKAHGSDPLSRDTDGDMIPDGWEVFGYAGFDFAAEGFSPARKDILCYVQRFADVDGARMRADLDRCAAYYASLRVPIALHFRLLAPIAPDKAPSRHWAALGNAFLPPEMRGLAHYMVVQRGGGGQSAQMGDMGGCGDQGLYATFLHEFGHQLGLDHTGFFPEPWCPLYTSLMNYAYNYSFDGSCDRIHYSGGEFAGHLLNESDLVEELPFAYERVAFLEKPPFQFRLQPALTRTRIDWNRNGRFDEGKVRADINTSYSTDGGTRYTLGKSIRAPSLVSTGAAAHLFSVNPEGRIERRDYLGAEKWSEAIAVEAPAATGDPLAVFHAGEVLLFVPSAGGVWCSRTKELLPDSDGCEVTAAPWQGDLIVGLWREGKARYAMWRRGVLEPWADSPLASTMPPAACEGPDRELWVGVGERQDDRRGSRWRLYRFDREGRPLSSRWVGGEASTDAGNRRPNLLYEAGEGRLHWIATGLVTPEFGNRACFWDAMTIGDAAYRDGWLLKRYYDEWTTSASAAAACLHDGEIFLAFRWCAPGDASDDNLIVSHRGSGIGNAPMGDFDDIGFIAGTGIARSILWRPAR